MKEKAIQMAGRIAGAVMTRLPWILRRTDGLEPPITRRDFLRRIPAEGPTLEIGPFNAPQLTHKAVCYFDVLDRAGLMARAQVHGLDSTQCPEIDFVSQTGDLDCVDRTFDNAFSSHCIEHQPDLARHLRQVESLLVPGGAYYLIIPDKRYCFDHYMAESRLPELYAAAAEKRTLHSDASILSHRLFTTHNRSLLHWLGLHGPRPSLATYGARIPAALAECAQARAGSYADVHAWCFTPAGFREAMEGMRRLGLTSLEVTEVHATLYGHLEFYAILRKPK